MLSPESAVLEASDQSMCGVSDNVNQQERLRKQGVPVYMFTLKQGTHYG